MVWLPSKVDYTGNLVARLVYAQEAQQVCVCIPAVNPNETGWFVVELPEGGVFSINPVQGRNHRLQGLVGWLLENPPVQTALLIPLGWLAEFTTHEQKLLARMRPHVGQVGTNVCQLLPTVTRHLGQ